MLRRFLKHSLVLKREVSALYVTGDKATENCVIISPYMEFEKRFNDLEEIEENLKARNSRLNLNDIKMEYEMYCDIEVRKKELDKRRAEISKLLRENPNNEGLKAQAKNSKEDLRTLKENSYHLEDQFIHHFLSLPNKLHDRTPKDGQKKILHTFLEPASKSSMEKLDNFMEHYNSQNYYLKGDAAMFDIEFPLKVSDFYYENNFMKFSTPDFVRSVIPEGAGVELDKIFLLKEEEIENRLNNLHLCGSGTPLSFIPFITKLVSFPSQFPLKLINFGKVYAQYNKSSDIYNLVQSTSNSVFVATADGSTFDEILEENLKLIKGIYEPLNLHFRVSIYPATELNFAESFKLGVELFSPFYQKYIEVGNFSYFADFISKRLLFNYKIGKDFHFPHIYSGSVNTTQLLINIIECKGKF